MKTEGPCTPLRGETNAGPSGPGSLLIFYFKPLTQFLALLNEMRGALEMKKGKALSPDTIDLIRFAVVGSMHFH
jgi:hypothetical protein